MVLQVLRHRLACVQTRFNLSVRYIPAYDNGAIQAQTRTDRVFRQDLAHICHGLVQVNTYGITLARLTQLFGNEATRVGVHLFNPDTILIDLALDVTVSRAAHAQTYRAACAVTRQPNHAYVVCHVFAAELCSQANLVRLLQ